jgi:hypothetical protein
VDRKRSQICNSDRNETASLAFLLIEPKEDGAASSLLRAFEIFHEFSAFLSEETLKFRNSNEIAMIRYCIVNVPGV